MCVYNICAYVMRITCCEVCDIQLSVVLVGEEDVERTTKS